jgi:hypothetical protein
VRERKRVIVGGILSPMYLKVRELELANAGSNIYGLVRIRFGSLGEAMIYKYMSVELGRVIVMGTEM